MLPQAHFPCKAGVPQSFSKGMWGIQADLGLEFPGYGLRQDAQGKLRAGQQRELGLAPHRCSGSCDEDGATPGFDHGWKRLHGAEKQDSQRGQQLRKLSAPMRAAVAAPVSSMVLHPVFSLRPEISLL